MVRTDKVAWVAGGLIAGITLMAALASAGPSRAQTASAASAAPAALDFEVFRTRVQPVFLNKRKGLARCFVCHSQGTTFRLQPLAPGVLPGQDCLVDLRDLQQRDTLAAKLFNEAQDLSSDRNAQYAWLGEVASRLGVDWENILRSRLFHLMNPAEVTDIARRGFDVQLHTHRHRTPRDKSAFCREVIENRRILEELAGRPATHFCYPSGDVDPIFLPWLRELEVETATTTRVGGLARAEHDPLLLPRYTDTMTQPEVWFESWVSGAGAIFDRRGA